MFVRRLPYLVTCALLLMLIVPLASASPVGVVVGDWWKYGSLGYGFYSDDPEATIPPEMLEGGPAWYLLEVREVSGTTVTLDMTIRFHNGTEVKGNAGGDLSTGMGNLTFFIFPAGFSKGDTMPNGAYINDTIPRDYTGTTREANVMNGTAAFMGTTMSTCIIFDKTTGIMCEFSMSVTTKQGNWTTSVSSEMQLTETNAFRAMPIPEIGGITGIMGLVTMLIGPSLWRRKRECY